MAWDVFQLTSSEFRGTGADRTWFGTFSTGGEKTVGEAGVVVDFYVSFVVARTATPATAVISPDTDLLELDGPESNWILAAEGDLVDESTSRHLDSCFFHAGLDDGTYSGSGSVEFPYGETCMFYMGFATGTADWDTGEHASKNIFYGWAQFEYASGKLSLVRSALNTAGGGIYVGTDRVVPVPEPAAGALALLGCALLLRRRRRPGEAAAPVR
ncbi:MAG: PEP-CTERM sorting domain-containing protein [Kiritimatiellae bacterium]|nr:PEP-CTERM sorting domain-containing protein [Kiritimatiellia bacterium]